MLGTPVPRETAEEPDVGSGVELGRITTDIPARMDRLPWARWHWLIVVGLGTVWILDGLEVDHRRFDVGGAQTRGHRAWIDQCGRRLCRCDLRRGCLPRRLVLRAADRPLRTQEALHADSGRVYGRHRPDRFLAEPDLVLHRPIPDRCRHLRGVCGDQFRDRRAHPGQVSGTRGRGDQRVLLGRCCRRCC